MKKMKIFKRISIIVLIVLCIASISFAAYLLNATEVSYDKDGTTVSVKDALDELHTEIANAPKKVFSQGQLVTYKGEEFYVLYDVSEIETTMEIFAKTNLNQAATAQANAEASETKCAFSSTNYWSSLWTSGNRLNLNNVTGYTSTDVLGKVDTYARTKGAIRGRLLTYEEAYEMGEVASSENDRDFETTNPTILDMLIGKGNTSQGWERYWLGSSDKDDNNFVCVIFGQHERIGKDEDPGDYSRGARPVLKVYKSDVTPVN